MKKMTLMMSMMLMIVMLATPGAYADTINVGDSIRLEDKLGYGYTSGGAFELYKGSAYQFDTFCMETNEYFKYGEPLYVEGISKQAMSGGSGGAIYTNGVWSDPLDQRTAYLYYNFRMNNLFSLTGSLFNYTAGNTSANALQRAIWSLENETFTAATNTNEIILFNTLINLANTASTSALQTAYNNVGVLNLKNSDGSNSQDTLTLTTAVPEPATMLLLGLGLIGLAGVRRKCKA